MGSFAADSSHRLDGLLTELELRLTNGAASPALGSGLPAELAAHIPQAETYVLVVIDGLGIAQLGHDKANLFRAVNVGTLQAPFPTTTSVSLATMATAWSPARHGVVSHLMWAPDLKKVVNTLKWVDLSGELVTHDYVNVLPRPNLWERLRVAGVEPITVQPDAFRGSPLSRLLYRGARFEGAWDIDHLVEATLDLAATPHRFIFTYLWQVDFAGHVHGLHSPEFSEAVALAAGIWERLAAGLPPNAALLGTADHGLIEYADEDKVIVREKRFGPLRFAGDSRGVHVWGDRALIDDYATSTGAKVVDPADLYDQDLTVTARSRLGDRVLLAPRGKVILPPGFDKRLRAYHGGLEPEEVEVPLLVA